MVDENVKYVNPNDRAYHSYTDHLFAFNTQIQREISNGIYSLFHDEYNDGILISATGSDARLEKGPASKIELILYHEGFDDIDKVMHDLREYISGLDRMDIFDQDVEVKNISKGNLCDWDATSGDKKVILVSPSRRLDSRTLFGDKKIDRRMRGKLSSELKNGDYGRSVFSRMKRKTKEYVDITESGKQQYKGREVEHYNINEGVAFYNPSENVFSFKQGPLRLVQYALCRDLVKAIRSGVKAERLVYAPRSVIARMNHFDVSGLSEMSHSEVSDFCDNYKYFLWLYHKSQVAYQNGDESVGFDSGEVRKRCADLSSLSKKSLVKAIEM